MDLNFLPDKIKKLKHKVEGWWIKNKYEKLEDWYQFRTDNQKTTLVYASPVLSKRGRELVPTAAILLAKASRGTFK